MVLMMCEDRKTSKISRNFNKIDNIINNGYVIFLYMLKFLSKIKINFGQANTNVLSNKSIYIYSFLNKIIKFSKYIIIHAGTSAWWIEWT